MPTQEDFWILVLIGLLIANLALLFYVKLDFDKKVSVLSQEVKGVKESLLYVKQDFDKRIIELLQEVNDIKANNIRFDKNVGEVSKEVKNVKESLLRVKQDFDKEMAELLQEINGIKANYIREIREKIEKLNAEMEKLEQQTKERIDRIAKLLTEPILDESELKI
jgi:predicted  nucleic acid-binding Zn-ribbon protein